jgi:tetratricopeptide (TPR) repeat protein
MARKDTDPITPTVAREICLRENIPAMVVPGITRAGNEYQLTAQLIDPSTGSTVGTYSERVRGEDRILPAMDTITSDIRRGLGESRLEIHQSHRPLPEVTTASLTALEAFADGSWMLSRNQGNDAVRLYQTAIAADPGFAMAHAALGKVYYSFLLSEQALGEQEFRKALALSERTTPRERSSIEIQYAESQERVADAFALYKSYLQQYPGDWSARYNYARLLRMHGHTAEAVPIYEQLAQHAPDDPSVFIELATAYNNLDQYPQSIQAYEKAFSIDRGMLVAGNVNREYGFTLVLNNQTAKAEQVFSALLQGDPATAANGERSLAFLDLYEGKYASARQHLMQALEKTNDPYSLARIRYMLAVVAAGQGNRREQVAQLDRILANFGALGQKVQYGALVGQAYVRAGEIEKARKIVAMITPLVNSRSEQQVAYAQLLKAEIAAAGGDYQSALKFLKPPDPDAGDSTAVLTRESLAHIYQKMGNLDQAIDWNLQFLRNGNGGAIGWEPQQQVFEALYNGAWEYEQRNAPTSATSHLNVLLHLWKDADPNLPLLKQAKSLRAKLVASH